MTNERNIHMLVIFDPNVQESREMMSSISSELQVDKIELQRVRKILPGIRATPAVGVLLWATDLQGLAADVEAFSEYIHKESEILESLQELGIQPNEAEILEQARPLRAAVQIAARYMPDAVAVEQPRNLFNKWAADTHYEAETLLAHENQLYRVKQPVDSIASQPPGAEGMLAIYRPVDKTHAGTQEDPIPYVYGMDCAKDKYYSYNGKVYLCKADMPACVWPPDTAGLWQWEAV